MTERRVAPEFVPLEGSELRVGRSAEADLQLNHRTVSRNHASLLPSGGDAVTVVDHDSRYGTFVNGTRVGRCNLVPGDRIQFGTFIVFRVVPGGLKLDHAARGVSLDVTRLSLEKGTRVLVRDVTFHVPADSFVGILGPSGAGKSTLLNCLASYHRPAAGNIVFDDCHDVLEQLADYRATLGHVPQDDIVYHGLSVQENLHFAARLRLDRNAGDDVDRLLEDILQQIGLIEHRNKLVSVLSGGQRKRLSVGIELLKKPRLLLLDEPTSGLDPGREAELMESLRHITNRGATVVCTTHLMANLDLFDQVIVLGLVDDVARTAYTGPPGELLERFHCRGYADLYQRLQDGRFLQRDTETPSSVPADSAPGGSIAPMPSRTPAPGSSELLPDRVRIGDLVTPLAADYSWHQFKEAGQRALLLAYRDRGLMAMTLLQPVLLGMLICLTQFSASRLTSLHFLCVVVALWLGMNNSARELVRDRRQYVRERLAGLRPGAYLASKAAVALLIGMIQVLLLLLIVRLGCRGILDEAPAGHLREASVVWSMLILLICFACGLGLGLLVSTLSRTQETAIAALPLLIMPQILVSAMATGQADDNYSQDRTFRPLVVTLRSPFTDVLTSKKRLPAVGVFVDVLSVGCYSRPATLLLEDRRVEGFGRWIWLADFCHLVILLLATWAALIAAFHWQEERWPRLLGLG
ncbi:MAG: ATP-binding cassette domain-containing protein [Pirellulaceae bacterium]|nr:ATP-binding cassette domain-containing protein [Pirellulaceae bacterium]